MKNLMTKLAAATMGMLLVTGAALAQDAQAPAPAPAPQATAPATAPPAGSRRGAARMTPEQRQQMQAIHKEARDRAAVIRNDATLTPEQKQTQLKALREQTRAKSEAVLTPEQKAKMADMRGMRHDRMKQQLGLSDEQEKQLKALRENGQLERQKLLADTTLTQDQKVAKLAEMRKAHQDQLKTILTPEQLQKMQQMRAHQKRGPRGGMHPGMGMNPNGPSA